MSESRETTKTLRISDVFLRPRVLEQNDNYDSFGRGMATQSFQKADKNFDIEVKEFLLKHLKKYGDDIRSIDIQRGRDHGIATYNEFRELCGLPKATKWEDYLDLISEEVSYIKLFITEFLMIFLILGPRKLKISLLKLRRC